MTHFILILYLSTGGSMSDTSERIKGEYQNWRNCEAEGTRQLKETLASIMATPNFASFNEPQPIQYKCEPVQVQG